MTARARKIRADGINNHLGPLCHLNRFFARHMALVVITVAKQDDRLPYRSRVGNFQKLVTTGEIQRVVKRGATSRPQHTYSRRERFRVVGEVLRDFGSDIKTDNKGVVI